MAAGGGLSTGGNYGRACAVVNWALDNWGEFDTWCCLKGLDPLELPSYRFHNLALYAIHEGMTEEQLLELENTLRLCDSVKHPLHELGSLYIRTKETSSKTTSSKANKKHDYIPPWWRGEDNAFKNAQAAMYGVKALPKMNQ